MVFLCCAFGAACGTDTTGNGGDAGDDCEGVRCVEGDLGGLPGNNGGPNNGMPNNGVDPDMGTPNNGVDPDMTAPNNGVEPDMGGPVTRCLNWTTPAADRARKIVVAKPADGDSTFEVVDMSATGELARTGQTFTLRGRASSGTIGFTRDGQFGYAVQEFNLDAGGNDRTLGVFRVANSGSVEIINPDVDPGFYVSNMVMDPSGDVMWGWENGWRNIGGALYRVELDCATGLPQAGVFVTEARNLRGMAFIDATRAVAGAGDILDDMFDENMQRHGHLLDFTTPTAPTRLSSVDLFPRTQEEIDADAESGMPTLRYIDDIATTHDGKYVVASNSALFSTHRIGVAAIEGDTLRQVQNIELADPSRIAMSPHDDAMIVLGVQDDAINLFSYDPNDAAAPFAPQGTVTTSTSTLLPASLTTIEQGSLDGTVIVSELSGLRVLQFQPGGTVTELDNLDFGEDVVEEITGAVGVQP